MCVGGGGGGNTQAQVDQQNQQMQQQADASANALAEQRIEFQISQMNRAQLAVECRDLRGDPIDRVCIGGASPPRASALQSFTQTRKGGCSAPASPSAPRLQRSKEWNFPPCTSETVKWASHACRVAHAEARVEPPRQPSHPRA